MIENSSITGLPKAPGPQLVRDEVTGFLEFRGGITPQERALQDKTGIEVKRMGTGACALWAFSGEKKVAFIKSYSKNWPHMSRAARKVGVFRSTVVAHMRIDQAFAEKVQEIIDEHVDTVELNMYQFSKLSRNYMDRMTLMRGYRPDMWDPAKKVIVSHEGGRMTPDDARSRLAHIGDVVDAEVVQAQFSPEELKASSPTQGMEKSA